VFTLSGHRTTSTMFVPTSVRAPPQHQGANRGTFAIVTALYTALISGAVGLLAGILPSFIMSRRRRTLKMLAEEADVLSKLSDAEDAKKHLQAAMRLTSFEYQLIVSHSPYQAAVERLLRFAPYLLALVMYGVMGRYLFRNELSAGSETARQVITWVSAAFFICGLVPLSGLALMVMDRRRQRPAHERSYRDMKSVERDALEAKSKDEREQVGQQHVDDHQGD
jgi:predicted histidine transporter YuiF (NhaC family)